MQPFMVPAVPPMPRIRQRTALIASADGNFRQRLSHTLTGLRWSVREADGGAAAWTEAESTMLEAVIVDSWLPDLDLAEFIADFHGRFPGVDILTAEGTALADSTRGPYRQELLYAMRQCQDTDTAAWNAASAFEEEPAKVTVDKSLAWPVKTAVDAGQSAAIVQPLEVAVKTAAEAAVASVQSMRTEKQPQVERLPELIGNAPCMLEISRRIRLVAPRMTPVLIEGPTGSGKELVAEAVHRLSTRSRKPFVAINCAAIPEALLEAELFGHTRGAFTGAVQGRTGRIEAADGGTLFLDEIGEMPLALQAKLLRFVECGELQRVGDNETVKVDVRIVAATHRPLAEHAHAGSFRSDLYYRLAVFLIRTPALSEHAQDLPQLVAHFMQELGRQSPLKRVDESAMARLKAHDWPGNVRELEHVLERGVILAGDSPLLTASDIDFGGVVN